MLTHLLPDSSPVMPSSRILSSRNAELNYRDLTANAKRTARRWSVPLWGFVVAFMLFNVNGSNLYFWIAIIPVSLVLLVGTKLQHVIATLALESAGITGSLFSSSLKPRDGLFWFKKPEFLLSLIHFILFQILGLGHDKTRVGGKAPAPGRNRGLCLWMAEAHRPSALSNVSPLNAPSVFWFPLGNGGKACARGKPGSCRAKQEELLSGGTLV
ncbi:MLO-like protein 11 [Platanthera guangdongensis]|uniref:MLO-like protein 11 n=1 Tax=Platanthera guangdongensis TaxID=2320717 RepID=A0ABR2MVG1_9ASPA